MGERGVPIPVCDIYPNRLNPNEMESGDFVDLKNDVKVDDYDPITVSPIDVFYTPGQGGIPAYLRPSPWTLRV